MKSTTKVWLFLIALTLLTLFLGYRLGDRSGLLLGFLFSVGFNILVLTTGNSFLRKNLLAREVLGQDPYNLRDRVSLWSQELAIQAPKVFLIESKAAVAFSYGSPWGESSICLSQGLLTKLTPAELDAVLAHQVCHILHMDSISFGVSTIVANTLVTFADTLDLLWPFRLWKKLKEHSKLFAKLTGPSWVPALIPHSLVDMRPFHFLISPVAWFLIRLNVRETSFLENDDLASQILPDKAALASALWKLESLSQARPLTIPDCSSHLFVVNPRGLREQNWFYLTHPKINTRIRRLVGYDPL